MGVGEKHRMGCVVSLNLLHEVLASWKTCLLGSSSHMASTYRRQVSMNASSGGVCPWAQLSLQWADMVPNLKVTVFFRSPTHFSARPSAAHPFLSWACSLCSPSVSPAAAQWGNQLATDWRKKAARYFACILQTSPGYFSNHMAIILLLSEPLQNKRVHWKQEAFPPLNKLIHRGTDWAKVRCEIGAGKALFVKLLTGATVTTPNKGGILLPLLPKQCQILNHTTWNVPNVCQNASLKMVAINVHLQDRYGIFVCVYVPFLSMPWRCGNYSVFAVSSWRKDLFCFFPKLSRHFLGCNFASSRL